MGIIDRMMEIYIINKIVTGAKCLNIESDKSINYWQILMIEIC